MWMWGDGRVMHVLLCSENEYEDILQSDGSPLVGEGV